MLPGKESKQKSSTVYRNYNYCRRDFSVFSLIYGKMEIDIQKNMKADGMAVSTYIEMVQRI